MHRARYAIYLGRKFILTLINPKMFNKKIKIPGFRPGFNEGIIKSISGKYRGRIYGCKFSKYCFKCSPAENLIPVNKAEIKDVDFRMNEHFSFVANFEIEPDLTLP